jgi:hypothetical protein
MSQLPQAQTPSCFKPSENHPLIVMEISNMQNHGVGGTCSWVRIWDWWWQVAVLQYQL